MEIIFFDPGKNLDDSFLDEMREGYACHLFKSPRDVLKLLKSKEGKDCALFIDYDENEKKSEKLNIEVKKVYPDTIRVVLSSKWGPKYFKEHQEAANSADGYFPKPVESNEIHEFLNDLLSEAAAETFVDLEIDSDKSHEITRSVSNNIIQAKFDEIFDKIDEGDSAGTSSQIIVGDDGMESEDGATVVLSVSEIKGQMDDESEGAGPDEIHIDFGSTDGNESVTDVDFGSSSSSDDALISSVSDDENSQGSELDFGDIQMVDENASSTEELPSDLSDDGMDLDIANEDLTLTEAGTSSGIEELSLDEQSSELDAGLDLELDGADESQQIGEAGEVAEPSLSMDEEIGIDFGESEDDGASLTLSGGTKSEVSLSDDLFDSSEQEDQDDGLLFDSDNDENEIEDSLAREQEQVGEDNVLSFEFGNDEQEQFERPPSESIEGLHTEISKEDATVTQQVGLELGTQVVKKLGGSTSSSLPVEEIVAPTDELDFSSEPERLERSHQEVAKVRDLEDEQKEFMQYYEAELIKLKATVEQLREGRLDLEQEISDLKIENSELKKNKLVDRAGIDEKNIELSLLKKRFNDQIDTLTYELRLNQDKKAIAEEKVKLYQSEFSKLNRRVKIDFKQLRGREAELEHQLELLKSDTQMQLKNRDSKILELKRKIDALEFDIDNLSENDISQKEEHFALEDKIDKAMSSLKMALGVLQDDETDMDKYAAKLKLQALKKKNMDA
jgi:hypothetical protein